MINRIASVAVGAAATVGMLINGALPASAAVNPTNFVGGPRASGSGCDVGLMWVSASTPDVAAEVGSSHPGHTCTGWVERSRTGATTTWSVASAKVALPSASGLDGLAVTGLVSDGPGYKARACVQATGSKAVICTSAVSVAKGSGSVTSPAFAASYARKQALIVRGTAPLGVCVGLLASSTTTKKSGASVLALLDSEADPCTAWIQTTANNGKTWTTVSPVVSYRSPKITTDVVAVTAHYADGPGHLARLCVKDMTSKKQNCSTGW